MLWNYKTAQMLCVKEPLACGRRMGSYSLLKLVQQDVNNVRRDFNA
jgi:hypothetical protein